MRRALPLFTLGAALLTRRPGTMAMSFGRTATATTLGQPLDFTAQLALDVDETLSQECVAGARHGARQQPRRRERPRHARKRTRSPACERSGVTTRAAVDEPVVTIDLTVGCRSQMARRFVAFVVSAALRLASTEPGPVLAPQRVETQVAPLLDIVGRADQGAPAPQRRDSGASRDGEPDSRRGARRSAPGRRFADGLDAVEGVVRPRQPAAARKRHARTCRALANLRGARRAAPAPRCRAGIRCRAAVAHQRFSTRRLSVRRRRGQTDTMASLASAAAALEAASAALAQERAHIAGTRGRPWRARPLAGTAEDDRRAAGAPAPGRGRSLPQRVRLLARCGRAVLRLARGSSPGVAAAPASARAPVRCAGQPAKSAPLLRRPRPRPAAPRSAAPTKRRDRPAPSQWAESGHGILP